MPSFSELAGFEGFFLSSDPALVSQPLTRSADIVEQLKDQPMLRFRLSVLALAGLSVACASGAATIVEDFTANPLTNGWQIFGDTSLFRWNSANQNLEVTWDSTHSNSFFYRPLGLTLTRYDDFTLEFDLRLSSIDSNVEPGKTGPLQISLGLLNLAEATSTNFMRGAYGSAPDVAEFYYYTSGYYDYGGVIYPSPASTVPSFIPGTDSYHYAPVYVSVYETELPINQTVHIRMVYTSSTQSASLAVTTNGVPLSQLAPLVLGDPSNSQFVPTDTFRVDTFSISSYSSVGDPFDSVLARGTVDNLVVTAQLQPITQFTGRLDTNGVWVAQFYAHSNWLYTLERAADVHAWAPASATAAGADGLMTLQDTNAPTTRAFYRVQAQHQ
jgi:hypothetical protein